MSRRRAGWRAAERIYLHLSRVLAQKAADEVKRNRTALADSVCPDGAACADPSCIAARASAMRGAGWREVHATAYHREDGDK